MFRVISYLLAAIVFATPWFIGGNWPFTRCVLAGTGAFGLFVVFVTQLLPAPKDPKLATPSVGFPAVWLFLVAGCLFTAFQASDLSIWLQERAGAANLAVSVHQTVGETIAQSDGTQSLSAARPISVHSPATREKLVDLVLAVGVFLISTMVLNRPDRIMPVMVALAASGVSISFIGILLRLSDNGKVLWQYELIGGGSPFGSFVNSNNAAGFLLIGFSAAIFFISYKLNKWKLQDGPDNLTLAEAGWESNTRRTIASLVLRSVAQLESQHLYFLAALAIVVAGVFTSLSRGGMLALTGSGLVGFFLIARTSRIVGVLLTLTILAGGLALVGFADQAGGIAEELDSLNDLSTAAAPRVQHWLDAIPFAKNNWLLGCGNGTYRLVSPSFDSFFSTKTFAHAESVYVETLIEMGIGGLLLLIAVLACCTAASLKLLYRSDAFDRALGVTGVTCLIGQSIAASLDFGIYQPGNALAMAMLMGGIVGRAATFSNKSPTDTQQQERTTRKSFKCKIAVLGLLLLAAITCSWATYESYGIESRRAGTRTVRLFNELRTRGQKAPSLHTLEQAEAQLKTATKIRPDDANANYYLGELSVMRYRHLQSEKIAADLLTQIEDLEKLKAFEENESTAEVTARREQIIAQQELLQDVDDSRIWNSTALLALHQSFRRAERIDSKSANEARQDTDVQKHLQTAWGYYQLAEDLCPRVPKTQLRLAQLDIFMPQDSEALKLDKPSESDRIDLALARANANTQLLFDCGFLALNSGDQPTAVRLWSKCLAFPHRNTHEKAVVELCQAELPMRLFFEKVLPQTPHQLTYYMRRYFEPSEKSIPMQLLADHTRNVIQRDTLPNSLEQFWLFAEVALLNQDYEIATKNYAEVEKFNSSKVADSFRYHYALSLFHSKQYDEAMRNVKICELELYQPRKLKKLSKQIKRERSIKFSTQ